MRQLEVLLNGKHVVGAPFAVEERPAYTNWVFGSMPADNRYALSESGAVVTLVKNEEDIDGFYTGAITDGAGCTPMTSGIHFWELAHVKHGGSSEWGLGVCRPGIDLNDNEDFVDRDDTWLMLQYNDPERNVYCTTCKGTGMTLDPEPKMPEGSRVWVVVGPGQRRHFDQ